MGKQFNPTHFVRRAPAALLKQYCENRRILPNFQWGSGKKVDENAFVEAVRHQQVEEDEEDLFKLVTADFRSIEALAGRGFTLGLLNEAEYRVDTDAVEDIKAQRSHLAKAFWATLNRPQFIPNAKILAEVDALPRGSWIKRKSLPVRGLPVDQSAIDELEAALVSFFTKKEWRGENCKIDCLRRGNEEIFFAYAEDHPQMDVFWQDGTLQQQVLSPSFRLIFKHKDQDGSLEIYTEGGRDVVPHLQQIFSKAIIGDEIPREPPPDDIIYDLSILLQPGFQFEYSSDLGIRDVRVTKMRFRVLGGTWRRFLVEANTAKERDALAELAEQLTSQLGSDQLVLDQAWIKVYFVRGANDLRDRSPSFCITAPNALRVQQNDFGERIAKMLVQSGIERAVPDDEQ